MLKSSTVNSNVVRAVGNKRTEKQTKVVKPSKNDEKTTAANSGSLAKVTSITKKNAIGRDLSIAAKSQIQSKNAVAKPKQVTATAPATRPAKAVVNKIIRNQPVKAIHQVQLKKPVSEKNVMNTIHNVTVSSPPTVRKELNSPSANVETSTETISRERTKTRILEPEGVLILNKSRNDVVTSIASTSIEAKPVEVEQNPILVREAVAYEINFEKPVRSQSTENSQNKEVSEPTDGDYEDDFDSYESDFESISSTNSNSASTASSGSASHSRNSANSTNSHSRSDSVNVTKKKVDEDREFDSGTYELKGVTDKLQLDSIDERDPHSEEQNDSGFGYNNSTPSPIEPLRTNSLHAYTKPPPKPTFSKRGTELMNKINLDTMSFTLFDLKPISYDLYMKIYGQRNTCQNSSQTIDNMIDQDVQTDRTAKQTIWTQFPPNFISNKITNQNYEFDRLGYGEDTEDVDELQASERCILETSLKRINKINVTRNTTITITIDYERLNYFLQKSAITISGLLAEKHFAKKELQNSNFSFSDGFLEVPSDTSRILKDTVICYVYSNSRIKNFLYLVHRQKTLSDGTCANIFFVSVWSVLDLKKPIHILSCWSSIDCLELHHNFQDVVIGGLSDGSLAVWNLTEPSFWHQNSDDETVLVPTQIVSASTEKRSIVFDFGAIVCLKGLYLNSISHEDESKLTQICSLHEFGMLTIWTIFKTKSHCTNLDTKTCERRLDHRSPWSKIQLIQSNIIDLGSIDFSKRIRPKSGFEKKKMYFESNLFSDEALRELQDFDSKKDFLDQLENFRCVDMECHGDGIVVATNKSFLIAISTSLNKDGLMKLVIDDSNFLSATKLKSMGDVLLVGLSNGTVEVCKMKNSNERLTEVYQQDSATKSPAIVEENNFSAKSCAIQNIIKEERKFHNDDDYLSKERFKEIGKRLNADSTGISHVNRFINKQILLAPMSLNRDFVRWLDTSKNLNCLTCLCGENLRLLNFGNLVEIQGDLSNTAIKMVAIAVGYNDREYLVILKDDNVRVHLLYDKLS